MRIFNLRVGCLRLKRHSMMDALSTTDMFQSVGLFSGSILPVAILLLFVILVLPGLARPGAHPEHLSKAAYCYLAESLGIILMSTGGLPAVYAVFSQEHLSTGTYMGLLLLFSIGGVVFLWHDSMLRSVASSSRAMALSGFIDCRLSLRRAREDCRRDV